MFDWLFLFFSAGTSHVEPPKQDLVGVVAAEAAYSALKADVVVKKKVPTKDCTTCKGTGRVRTGDDHEWTKCPDCDPELGLKPEDVKTPKSEPNRYK